MLICIRSCIVNAEKKLVPRIFRTDGELQDPENFNVNLNKNGINPFA